MTDESDDVDDGKEVDRSEEYPPESMNLAGDDDNYPVICPSCGRHVTDRYGHNRACEHWGEVTDPRPERE